MLRHISTAPENRLRGIFLERTVMLAQLAEPKGTAALVPYLFAVSAGVAEGMGPHV
jgi:hypothetical protein